MDSKLTALVAELPPTPPKFKKFLPIIALVLAIIVGLFFFFLFSKKTETPKTLRPSPGKVAANMPKKAPIPSASTLDSQASLGFAIKSVFTDSSTEDINNYISAAAKVKTPEEAYHNYVLAFESMKEIFNKSRDPRMKLAMLQLKNYVEASTEYQESDFIIDQ